VLAILPGLSPEQAQLAAQLATVAVEAAIWPLEIPEPVPAPMYEVLLSASVRFGQAILQGTSLPVVGESLGSYSYRLAQPATLTGAFGLTSSELDALAPWTRSGAYDVPVGVGYQPWPVDWWQRDYDNLEGEPSLGEPGPPGPPGPMGPPGQTLLDTPFMFSAATSEPPSGSQVRFNSDEPQTTTLLWVRNVTTDGFDVHELLVGLGPGVRIYVQQFGDHTAFAEFGLTGAPVDKDSYVELPVSWLAGGAPLSATKVEVLVIAP
jgi:hypothetical protein